MKKGKKKTAIRLHLISAYDAALAAREAAAYGGSAQEQTVLRAACLLAKALYEGDRPMFPDGLTVARRLPAETLLCWAKAYATLSRAENFDRWEEEKDRLARDETGRLRWKVLQQFGVLPWEKRAKEMTDGDLLYCILQMVLDSEDALARLCPQCRSDLLTDQCPVCGAVQYGMNPNFDTARFEELKSHGLSDTVLS